MISREPFEMLFVRGEAWLTTGIAPVKGSCGRCLGTGQVVLVARDGGGWKTFLGWFSGLLLLHSGSIRMGRVAVTSPWYFHLFG